MAVPEITVSVQEMNRPVERELSGISLHSDEQNSGISLHSDEQNSGISLHSADEQTSGISLHSDEQTSGERALWYLSPLSR